MAAQVAEELNTVTFATLPMEECKKEPPKKTSLRTFCLVRSRYPGNRFQQVQRTPEENFQWQDQQDDKPLFKRLQSQGHVKMAYRCSKFNA